LHLGADHAAKALLARHGHQRAQLALTAVQRQQPALQRKMLTVS